MSTSPYNFERNLPRPLPWTNSYWLVILLALCIGMSAILVSLTLDRALHNEFRPLYASDWLEALVAAVLSGAALMRIQARRRELLVRMQIVEDVNHHVRNALTSIVFSASLREDPELNAQVSEACARIDWVLSDVLSQSVDGRAHWRERSKWGAGRRLQG
ncbi:MAG: hypothetical protein NVSMB62_02000 [Acidobacteriaceae bacterium]